MAYRKATLMKSDQHLLANGTRVSELFMQEDWEPGLYYHILGKAVPGRTLIYHRSRSPLFLAQGVAL